jgi:hypothetical protein
LRVAHHVQVHIVQDQPLQGEVSRHHLQVLRNSVNTQGLEPKQGSTSPPVVLLGSSALLSVAFDFCQIHETHEEHDRLTSHSYIFTRTHSPFPLTIFSPPIHFPLLWSPLPLIPETHEGPLLTDSADVFVHDKLWSQVKPMRISPG